MVEKFEFIRPSNAPVANEEIIDDLKAVAKKLQKSTVTQKDYGANGNFDCTTVSRRFGTWNKALKVAQLSFSNESNISDEGLYENILNLWQHFGRQPRRSDLTSEMSSFSQSPYNRRFETWTNSLQNFVNYANGEDLDLPNLIDKNKNGKAKKIGRDPSLRLRYKVLLRDNFTCKQCGASPAKDQNIELHIDHIIPWSKNGETTLENLQTLCSSCNLGKSNL
ncbi:MAG: HNH endonuclease [Sulfurimonas sp.]|uniref:homing endonuclease associated repeat-containing protein n=1 Tax=Sulfurimonas sp. TaxID=2022749 RepID=UPI003564C66B